MYYYSALHQSISPSGTHPVSNLLHAIVRLVLAIQSWARDTFYPRFRCSLLQLSSPSPPPFPLIFVVVVVVVVVVFFFFFLIFVFTRRMPPPPPPDGIISLPSSNPQPQMTVTIINTTFRPLASEQSCKCSMLAVQKPKVRSHSDRKVKWISYLDANETVNFATRKRAEFTSIRMFSPSILIVCKAELMFFVLFFLLLLGSAAEFYIPKTGSLQT